MQIVKARYEIMDEVNGLEVLKKLEKIGRLCYKSEDKITDESAPKFLRAIVDRGHEAMIEHYSVSVLFTVDRGVTHEAVRHRIASFAQESTRYCNYSKGKYGGEITVVDIAPGMELDTKVKNLPAEVKAEIIKEWVEAVEYAEAKYLRMLELGATPQIARGVLPTSTKAGIVITANLREWRKILSLRTPLDAHPQIREVMIPLLNDFQQLIPVIFDDISAV